LGKHARTNTYSLCTNDMIFAFSAVSSIDTSGVSLFKELEVTLKMKGAEVRLLKFDKFIDLRTLKD